MSGQRQDREDRNNQHEMVIDNVLTSQPELGPSIPDGGYGWVVFFVTLFFQALIPSLIVSFGIFLAFSKLQKITSEDVDPRLWDNNLLYVPLLFTASWTFFDPTTRALISHSTWPRLVATAGTCLTCAGLLFLWMGMTGYGESSLFILSGLVSGVGSSIQIAQCEILLAQYFRLKYTILAHITQAVSAIGCIVAPIAVGHHVFNTSLLHVILWYQAIILQGLVLNLALRKPLYLKSKQTNYNYITSNADDEEDILSKNSRELQIKRQNSNGTKIETHEISPSNNDNNAGPSTNQAKTGGQEHTKEQSNSEETINKAQLWETFEEDDEEETKYEKLKDWETFDEDLDIKKARKTPQLTQWEQFEDMEETLKHPSKPKNLQLELSYANEESYRNNRPMTSISGLPLPLFSDLPVNNNNTYSYDVIEDQTESRQHPAVFMPTTVSIKSRISRLELLQQPTFYKSLLMVVTTKFSIFIFFTLFPSYLFQELPNIKIRNVSNLMGILSLASLLFAGISYWINIDKRRRPICLWFLCWVGAFGYYMISDYHSEYLMLFGAVQVMLSIATLQHVGGPLLGLTIRGEATPEFGLISIMTGGSFLFFLIINSSFKDCFRLMGLLHFITGGVWFVNFVYKRLKR